MGSELDAVAAAMARLADIPDEVFDALDVPDESPELEDLAALPRWIVSADEYEFERNLPEGWNRCGCGTYIPCRHCDPDDTGPDCGA